MKATTVKEVLVATRWIIQHYGWCQGHSYIDNHGEPTDESEAITDSFGGACLSGAMQLVECDVIVRHYASMRVQNTGMSYIPTWNDMPGRTKEEVLSLLDRLIAEA